MPNIATFSKLAKQFCAGNSANAARNATRLWNWADHQANPEPFWQELRSVCPQFFYSRSANSFHFTY